MRTVYAIPSQAAAWRVAVFLAASCAAHAQAQTWTVRMVPGTEATVTRNGQTERLPLGSPAAGRSLPPSLRVDPAQGGAPPRICCEDVAGTSMMCEGGRGVTLRSPRQFVLAQYGSSRSPGSGPGQLNYPGIQYEFDNYDRVRRICITPLAAR